jgi:glycosyltransferase involved in cell wall biosynthesis
MSPKTPAARSARALRNARLPSPERLRAPGESTDDGPMRILLLTSEAPPTLSGVARTVGTLSTELRARGHAVDIVSRRDFPRLTRAEIRLSSFGLFWRQFRRRLTEYDVVNVHGPVPTISETFLWLMRGVPEALRPGIVYTHHSDLAIPGLERLCEVYNRSTRGVTRVADAVVVTSEHYRVKMTARSVTPVQVIPWAVDSSLRQPHSAPVPGRLRVLFVGQLRPYKGLPELLSAVGAVPSVDLTVIGDGPMHATVAAQVRDMRLDRVTLRGRVDEDALWAAYADADVVVLPSTTTAEAYGLVLVEGMAAGCVPVASDLPGVRDVAGPSGVLVPPGDADALAGALRALAEDPARLRVLAKRSLARAADLDVQTMIDAHERVLRAAQHDAAHRHGRTVTPGSWADPASFLRELDVALGTPASTSLSLVDLESGRARVWDTGPHPRIRLAPVATWVARDGNPAIISRDTAPHRLAVLLQRDELTSSVVIPLHAGPGHRAVLSASSDSPDVVLDRAHVQRALTMLHAGRLPAAPSGFAGSAAERPLRLVVDGRVLVTRYEGIGRITIELLRALADRNDVEVLVLVGAERPPAHLDPAELKVQLVACDVPLFGPSHLWTLDRRLRALNADVAFFPYHLAAPIGPGLPRLVMLHDCIFEVEPGAYPQAAWTRPAYLAATRAVARTGTVVTVSVASAGEIERHHGVQVPADAIVANGVGRAFAPGAPRVLDLRLPDRYLLTVGARRPHKNLPLLAHALRRLPPDVHLVCVGRVDERFTDPFPQVVERLGLTDRVHHRPSVTDAELVGLYAGARALVYPSRTEGFGLPLLEAMAVGTPVIASDVPVLAEVAGSAALYAPHDRPDRWAATIERVLTDDTLRAGLIARGHERAAGFTWQRSAEQLVTAARRAVAQHPGRVPVGTPTGRAAAAPAPARGRYPRSNLEPLAAAGAPRAHPEPQR